MVYHVSVFLGFCGVNYVFSITSTRETVQDRTVIIVDEVGTVRIITFGKIDKNTNGD